MIWDKELEGRRKLRESICPTGNPWLEDGWCGGVDREQLVMLAAKTGVGKTFFGVQLATAAARAGKRVYYFALEAARFEIERRRLFTELHRIIREHYPQFEMPRFREWLHMELDESWLGIEKFARERIDQTCTTLQVKYRTGAYAPDEFERDAHELMFEAPDLIVLDHLHHFLLQGEESVALKSAIRTIDRLRCDLNVPIVVLAQLRKDQGKSAKGNISRLEDIRGTAALTDISTDVITISRVPREKAVELPRGLFNPMYFHAGKSRTAPEMQEFVAVVGFDYKTGEYQKNYFLTRHSEFDDPSPLIQTDIPKWAPNARASQPGLGYKPKVPKSWDVDD